MSAYYKTFQVQPLGTNGTGLMDRPVVEIRVIGPRDNRPYEGRLDTGADETVLPWKSIALMGVKLIPGKVIELEGIGGIERVMFGLVDLEIIGPEGPIRWSHEEAFSPSDRTLFELNGFLEYFVARFDGVRREVRLQYRGKAPLPRFEPPLPRRPR